ncbi:MAG: HupE/UreJ family protein [Cognatishimia sp.]
MSIFLWLPSAHAHELDPTVADIEVQSNQVHITIRLNAEAFLAELDLDTITDTDASSQSQRYDQLQALSGAEIAQMFSINADKFFKGFTMRSDEKLISLVIKDIETPDHSIPDIARQSTLQLVASLPPGATSISVSWAKGYGPIVIRQQGVESPYTGFLSGGETTPAIQLTGGAAQSAGATFLSYVPVGFDHILPKGLDHILFVLGLFFLSLRMGPLLWQVSAFTLAHTVTLALGALGWVAIPGSIVEPLIAASIAYVGLENVFSKGLSRWRPIVVFGFGLLHGLGFASVLGDFGLPAGQFLPALIGFNIGVELGQLTVIAVAFLLLGLSFGKKTWYRSRIANPLSIAIAAVGTYWFFERVFM